MPNATPNPNTTPPRRRASTTTPTTQTRFTTAITTGIHAVPSRTGTASSQYSNGPRLNSERCATSESVEYCPTSGEADPNTSKDRTAITARSPYGYHPSPNARTNHTTTGTPTSKATPSTQRHRLVRLDTGLILRTGSAGMRRDAAAAP